MISVILIFGIFINPSDNIENGFQIILVPWNSKLLGVSRLFNYILI